jgi:hypothetical protein
MVYIVEFWICIFFFSILAPTGNICAFILIIAGALGKKNLTVTGLFRSTGDKASDGVAWYVARVSPSLPSEGVDLSSSVAQGVKFVAARNF